MLHAIGRSLGAFAFALALLRLTGRKALSQLNYFDFLTVSMIGGLFTDYILNPKQSLKIFLAPMGIIAADLLADKIAIKSQLGRTVLEGKPTVFIENGKIVESNVHKMNFNIGEVLAALRHQGIYNLGDVEFAVLEIDGKISVLKKSQESPLTPKDLNIPTQYQGLSSVIISDGRILPENLQKNNLSQGWLENKLKEQGVNDISQVFLASLATNGSLYVDFKGG